MLVRLRHDCGVRCLYVCLFVNVFACIIGTRDDDDYDSMCNNNSPPLCCSIASDIISIWLGCVDGLILIYVRRLFWLFVYYTWS